MRLPITLSPSVRLLFLVHMLVAVTLAAVPYVPTGAPAPLIVHVVAFLAFMALIPLWIRVVSGSPFATWGPLHQDLSFVEVFRRAPLLRLCVACVVTRVALWLLGTLVSPLAAVTDVATLAVGTTFFVWSGVHGLALVLWPNRADNLAGDTDTFAAE